MTNFSEVPQNVMLHRIHDADNFTADNFTWLGMPTSCETLYAQYASAASCRTCEALAVPFPESPWGYGSYGCQIRCTPTRHTHAQQALPVKTQNRPTSYRSGGLPLSQLLDDLGHHA